MDRTKGVARIDKCFGKITNAQQRRIIRKKWNTDEKSVSFNVKLYAGFSFFRNLETKIKYCLHNYAFA